MMTYLLFVYLWITVLLKDSCQRMCRVGCAVNQCQYNGKCTKCVDGYRDTYCTERCSDGCYNKACLQNNGTCKHGCKEGYFGENCCPSGLFGWSCEIKCPTNCFNCTSQYNCQKCKDGFYGTICNNECLKVCKTCSRSWDCSSCKTGFFGQYWNAPQLDGPCSPCSTSCIDGQCRNSTGNCIKGCVSGFWNLSCESRCKANCSICEQKSGTCLACSSTSQYGNECSLTCSDTCVNASCHMNGTCTSGCIPDFIGPSCEKQCPLHCARKDFDTRCSKETGNCLFGCSAGFTGVDCMEALKQETNEDTVPSAAIGGGVAAAVIVVVVVAVAVLIYLRRRHRQPKHDGVQETSPYVESPSAPVYASVVRSEHSRSVYENTSSVTVHNAPIMMRNPAHSKSQMQPKMSIDVKATDTEEILEIDEWDNIARLNAIRFEENGGVYYNNDNKVKNLKIPVTELTKFVLSKNNDYYEAEFEKLPYGLMKENVVSQMKVNVTKNRYKGIYPYDDHRVKVRGGDTDYINASFVDGFKRRNEYIAILGPMSQQLGDFGAFWKIVWQQNVEKIVMVTNLLEGEIDKCEQYWPNVGASKMYGGIRVSCTREDDYAEFTRRSFAIVKANTVIDAVYFTSWPDKDVPEDVTSIIEFRQNVKRAPATLVGPIIVHCSAGVGRTGTYIAIDILTNEGEGDGAIDIPGCVLNMRQNRPNMVQTVGQYKYLHHTVVHSLSLDCSPVAGAQFQLYMDKTSKDKIMNMFQQIQDIKTYGSLDETEAVERNAKRADKNREGADIPGDEKRLRLVLNRKPGSTDYINAVFVNSFKTKNKYVLAQTPLPNTVVDFITMLVHMESSCIVAFDQSTMHGGNIGQYLPAYNQVLKMGIFSVRCSKPEANAYRIKRTMTIEHRANQANAELSLTHLEFTDWNIEEPIPNSPSDFRRFIAEVDAVTASANSDKPVVVHCWEQFQFCHDCVLDYVQSCNTYANVAAELSDC